MGQSEAIAVLGGDQRMFEAVRCFLGAGLQVRVAGQAGHRHVSGLQVCTTAAEALDGAQVAVLPVQGVTEEGRVFTKPGDPELSLEAGVLSKLQRGATVFVGIGSPYLREACAAAGATLVEYREADEFAIWNSIPSAEGAIQMAMEATPFTLFGSRALVLGFGRTGRALALLLKGLFAEVTVAVRREMDYARVWAAGYRFCPMAELEGAVSASDVIFNTVPAQVLTKEVLSRAPAHAVIIDVASMPGGTDFEAARRLGLTARLAPGLPGIVAPVTAGKIIADMILRHLTPFQREEGGQ